MSRKIDSNTAGLFTSNFNHEFYVETPVGNYIYDPFNSTLISTKKTYLEWIKADEGGYGRDVGIFNIFKYCGDYVIIIDEK